MLHLVYLHVTMWIIATIICYKGDSYGVKVGKLTHHSGLWNNLCWGFIWPYSIPEEILKYCKRLNEAERELKESLEEDQRRLEQQYTAPTFQPLQFTAEERNERPQIPLKVEVQVKDKTHQ